MKKNIEYRSTTATQAPTKAHHEAILLPLFIMNRVNKCYPTAFDTADMFRAERGTDDCPEWSEWCFLPHGAWHAYVGMLNNDFKFTNHALIVDISILAAIVPWSITQGIYYFDSDLISRLDKETFRYRLPVDSFKKLPEWSVYIVSQKLSWFGKKLHGFWVSLEEDANTGEAELRFLLVPENGELQPQIIHIGEWSLAKGIDKAFRFAKVVNPKEEIYELAVYAECEEIRPLVAMVLYLCSDDYLASRGLLEERAKPKPLKTKHGIRHRPAEKPTIYNLY